MTRQHFERLARAVYAMRAHMTPEQQRAAANEIALACAEFSPRFDRARFLKACGC